MGAGGDVWTSDWTKCPACRRDWGVRLAGSMVARPLSGRPPRWALAFPIKRPGFDPSEVWDCSCGARLRVGRRRNRVRDFAMAGAIAVTWAAACFLTGAAMRFPIACWFGGTLATLSPLILSGAGKHEVQL